ncbi:hypothetical protein [Nesterenkonia suensis]
MSDFEDKILDYLIDELDKEPPQDAGQHPSMELHERVGAAWAEWDKGVQGLRLLLGVRLVNEAIERRKAERTDDATD